MLGITLRISTDLHGLKEGYLSFETYITNEQIILEM